MEGIQAIHRAVAGLRWLPLAAAGVMLAACGGGGSSPSATSEAAGRPGVAADAGTLSVTLEAPQRIGTSNRFALSWTVAGAARHFSVQVQRAADEAFEPVDAVVAAGSAQFERGVARGYDYPSARVRVQACDAAQRCVYSNVESLTGVLLATTARLHSDPPPLDGVFGDRLAFSADGRRLAAVARANVAQPEEPFIQRGQVFIYDRGMDGAWRQTALVHRPQAPNDFGAAIALSGDGNTLVSTSLTEAGETGGIDVPEVAGWFLQGDAGRHGAVHVYVRGTDGSWTREAFIKPAAPLRGEYFGRRVSLSDDGRSLLVSARARAVLFQRGATGWREVQTFATGNLSFALEFGAAISGDGRTIARPIDLPACAPDGGPSAGIEVLRSSASEDAPWVHVTALASPRTQTRLGSNPVLSRDGRTLAVGAGDDSSTDAQGRLDGGQAPGSGGVLLFHGNPGGAWSAGELVKPRSAQAGDDFGSIVRLSADGRVLAGLARGLVQNVPGLHRNHAAGAEPDPALLAEPGGLGGAVYVFERDAGGAWAHLANAVLGDPGGVSAVDFLGFDLSADGDTLGLGGTAYGPVVRDAYVSVF